MRCSGRATAAVRSADRHPGAAIPGIPLPPSLLLISVVVRMRRPKSPHTHVVAGLRRHSQRRRIDQRGSHGRRAPRRVQHAVHRFAGIDSEWRHTCA